MKDNFSKQAEAYARFRPSYPTGLIHDLVSMIPNRQSAWDCATGNGQVAAMLAPYFEKVFATDISENQLSQATQIANIEYSKQAAEATSFPDTYFDLITVGQAVHWFDFDKFYPEVRRVAKPGCLLALIGYSLFETGTGIDASILHFYKNTIGPFWDEERKHVENKYQSVPFPFEEIKLPAYYQSFAWDFDTLLGYLASWSAVQHFIAANGPDPVQALAPELRRIWGREERITVRFEFFTRIGLVKPFYQNQ